MSCGSAMALRQNNGWEGDGRMHNSKIDVAVLLIFFNRPNTFAKVFEQVKIARPHKLFLYQDGARDGVAGDKAAVEQCRRIAGEIDWECEVHQNYQRGNHGCDPSEYMAQKWAFGLVDKCIVLEDDDVPSQSFFPFCKELLDRYENDERINMICGMNHMGVYEGTAYDYLFSYGGSITGWASWGRVVRGWTEDYPLLADPASTKKFVEANRHKYDMRKYIATAAKHRKSGKAHYESILSYHMFANHSINIVPKYNLISNIGNNSEGGTHAVRAERLLPKGIRKIFSMKTYEYSFPLNHPGFVMEDVEFKRRLDRIMGNGYPLVKLYRKWESRFLRIRHGEASSLLYTLKKRLRKKAGAVQGNNDE